MYNKKCQNQLVKMLNQSAKVTYYAINIHLPNKVVYPYALLTLNILSSQYEHQYPLN